MALDGQGFWRHGSRVASDRASPANASLFCGLGFSTTAKFGSAFLGAALQTLSLPFPQRPSVDGPS